MPLTIKPLAAKAFAPYGLIIHPGAREPQGEARDWKFFVIAREPASPWRIGYYMPNIKVLRKLEKHPDSLESFEPVSGTAVLIVALEQSPQLPEAFLLDAPVILHKGIWHGVISLSAKVAIKITENLEVASDFYPLARPLRAALV